MRRSAKPQVVISYSWTDNEDGFVEQLAQRLRKELRIQLVNFDLNEIIALDRDADGNVRRLDRQILNFSIDEIYDWLMRTRPSGAAMEQILQQEGQSEAEPTALAELMRTTPTSGPATAHEQVSEFRDILTRAGSPTS